MGYSAISGWTDALGVEKENAWRLAREHLKFALGRPTPLAHQVASKMLSAKGGYEAAIDEAEQAIALDPNDPIGHVALGRALIYSDNHRTAPSSSDSSTCSPFWMMHCETGEFINESY